MTAAFSTLGADTSDSAGTAVTCGVDSKGSYTEIVASTSAAAKGIWICFNQAQQLKYYAMDVAFGADGSEVVEWANLLVANVRSVTGSNSFYFPCDIPSGTRIAVRGQTSGTSGSEIIDTVIILSTEGTPGVTSPTYETYGVTLGADDPYSTGIDPGGTINTKATSFTEIEAASASDMEQLLIMFDNNENAAMATANWLVDIAIGASTSEVVVVANWPLSSNATTDELYNLTLILPGNAFQSARISVRAQCSINDATDRLINVSMYAAGGVAVAGGGGGIKLAGRGGGLAG